MKNEILQYYNIRGHPDGGDIRQSNSKKRKNAHKKNR